MCYYLNINLMPYFIVIIIKFIIKPYYKNDLIKKVKKTYFFGKKLNFSLA